MILRVTSDDSVHYFCNQSWMKYVSTFCIYLWSISSSMRMYYFSTGFLEPKPDNSECKYCLCLLHYCKVDQMFNAWHFNFRDNIEKMWGKFRGKERSAAFRFTRLSKVGVQNDNQEIFGNDGCRGGRESANVELNFSRSNTRHPLCIIPEIRQGNSMVKFCIVFFTSDILEIRIAHGI